MNRRRDKRRSADAAEGAPRPRSCRRRSSVSPSSSQPELRQPEGDRAGARDQAAALPERVVRVGRSVAAGRQGAAHGARAGARDGRRAAQHQLISRRLRGRVADRSALPGARPLPKPSFTTAGKTRQFHTSFPAAADLKKTLATGGPERTARAAQPDDDEPSNKRISCAREVLTSSSKTKRMFCLSCTCFAPVSISSKPSSSIASCVGVPQSPRCLSQDGAPALDRRSDDDEGRPRRHGGGAGPSPPAGDRP